MSQYLRELIISQTPSYTRKAHTRSQNDPKKQTSSSINTLYRKAEYIHARILCVYYLHSCTRGGERSLSGRRSRACAPVRGLSDKLAFPERWRRRRPRPSARGGGTVAGGGAAAAEAPARKSARELSLGNPFAYTNSRVARAASLESEGFFSRRKCVHGERDLVIIGALTLRAYATPGGRRSSER